MAEKRMFTKKITDDDNFISMSSSAQALYFHLNQGADDDGFTNQITIAMQKAHASEDDLGVLLAKRYVLRFDSGVIVIKHWRMHNTLRKDRYTPTNYQEELELLGIKKNGAYTLNHDESTWLPNGCQMVATVESSIDKSSIVKGSRVVEEAAVSEADKNLSEAVKAYESNIGTISAKASDGINEWLEKGADVSLIIFAIEQAAAYNARNWKYTDKVIASHFNAGRKTREAAETYGKNSKKSSSAKTTAAKGSYELDDMAAAERKARLEKMRKGG